MKNGISAWRLIMPSYVVYGKKYPWIPSFYRSDHDPDIDAPNILEAVKKYNEKPNNEYYVYSARCIMWSESWNLDERDFRRMKTTHYWKKKKEMEELEKNNPHLNFSSWKNKEAILKNSQDIEILQQRFYIYFLIRENEIVYIGQTHNFITRFKNHKKKKKIKFDRYYLQPFECTEKEIKLIESQLILHHKPCDNENLK